MRRIIGLCLIGLLLLAACGTISKVGQSAAPPTLPHPALIANLVSPEPTTPANLPTIPRTATATQLALTPTRTSLIPTPALEARSTELTTDGWPAVAAQVSFPLFVFPESAAITLVTQPTVAKRPIKDGGPCCYPAVVATYQLPAVGAHISIIEMNYWPADQDVFGTSQQINGVTGFYDEDAGQHRLIFQPGANGRSINVTLIAPDVVSRATLFALATTMRPLATAAAAPASADPALAQKRIQSISFIDDLHGWLLRTVCSPQLCAAELWATTDGGNAWSLTRQLPNSENLSLRFFSLQDGMQFGPTGLWITPDGGRSWKLSLAANVLQVEPVGNTIWAIARAVGSYKAGLYYSNNNGDAWQLLPAQPSLWWLAALAHTDASHAWVISAQDTDSGHTALSLTADAGKSWRLAKDPCYNTERFDLTASGSQLWLICLGDPGVGSTDQQKALYSSADAGQSWRLLALHDFGTAGPSSANPLNTLPVPRAQRFTALAPATLLMSTALGGVVVSKDGGKTWLSMREPLDQIDPGGAGISAFVFVDAQTGWIAGAAGIAHTQDGGLHWQIHVLP